MTGATQAVLAILALLASTSRAAAPLPYRWMWTADAEIPCDDIVWAGVGVDDYPVFLGRVHYFEVLSPALVQYTNKTHPAIFYNNGVVDALNAYEVLCGTGLSWSIQLNPTDLPSNALAVGYTAAGKPLYACRAVYTTNYIGVMAPGVVSRPAAECLFPVPTGSSKWFSNIEVGGRYEILVVDPEPDQPI